MIKQTNDVWEYHSVEYLPSGFKAYPKGSSVSYRMLKFPEVAAITNIYQRAGALDGHVTSETQNSITRTLIKHIRESQVIKTEGFPFLDLTLGDWLFLYLSVMAESHLDVKYLIHVPCNNCSNTLPDAGIDLKPIKHEIRPNMIEFDSAEDEVEMPVMLETDSQQDVEIDFLRVKHYLQRLKNPSLTEVELLVSPKDAPLSIMDVSNVNYVRGMMDHMPVEQVEITCPACQEITLVDVKWSEFALTVKSPQETDRRSRIHFGKRPTSAVHSAPGDELPSCREDV